MSVDIKGYNCPNCGGILLFDISAQKAKCRFCGAELYGGKTAIAMVCPCCGNAQIVVKRIQGILKPDSIIPFQHDKETAIEALKNFCAKRKRLLPDRFIKENRLGAIQGVYAPFWLFGLGSGGVCRI